MTEKPEPQVGVIMVVGSGIAGLESSLDLANSGYQVYLVEKKSVIGGTVTFLDEQFPTNNCQFCSISTRSYTICRKQLSIWLKKVGQNQNIKVLTNCEVQFVTGGPGNFRVSLQKKTPNQEVCEQVCKENARELIELEVGAIILNPGVELFDPAQLTYYGYSKYPNVITSLEFERLISQVDPLAIGHTIIRPSDGQGPKHIAWIQCVGSRNLREGKDYCSSVCCMSAVKEALMAKKYSTYPLQATIFHMDLRTQGKGYERYYQQASKEEHIHFVRTRIHEVTEAPDGSHNLIIRYATEDGTIITETFDLVVLSVGYSPDHNIKKLAEIIDIQLDQFGFCLTKEFSPTHTSREGVFAGGVFCGPKDIAQSITEASAAALNARKLLISSLKDLSPKKEYPPERDIEKEKAVVGVFICNGGAINIGKTIDVPQVLAYTKTLRDVAYAVEFTFLCSEESHVMLKKAIQDHGLNRIVIAACTPHTQENLIREKLKEAGLNPYLYEHVNLREQVAWVHQQVPEKATEKAKDLIRMAVAKAKLLHPVQSQVVNMNRWALVVGGGVSGMVSAISLTEQGYEVILVEKSGALGGNAKHLNYTIHNNIPRLFVQGLIDKIHAIANIHLYLNTEITSVTGHAGNYRTTLQHAEFNSSVVEHGAVIIAIGAQPVKPQSYFYGQHAAVLTQLELEQLLQKSGCQSKNVVMIQCVESRDENRPYCSKVCCTQAMKNALKIKDLEPETNVFILYRDITTYGLLEQYYTEARRKGVIFIRYQEGAKPNVTVQGEKIKVEVRDQVLGLPVQIDADLLVLSSGIEPSGDALQLSRLFKVSLNQEGFFSEKNIKFRPSDMEIEGIYLCGLAGSPTSLGESITQAEAAAMRATTFLEQEVVQTTGNIAVVDTELCRGCGLCVTSCPYGARVLHPYLKVALVDEMLCQGCGICVASCPSGASQQRGYEKQQLLAMIDAALI